MRSYASGLIALPVVVMAVLLARADEPAPEPSDDVKLLREAGVGTDPAGLLAFWRSHTPSADEHARLLARVGDLGSELFLERERASRELTRAGRLALPLLRPALDSPDLEVARRAARCIEAIDQSPAVTLVTAAARVTAACRPPGAAAALLAALPFIHDESAEEAVTGALVAVGLRAGVPEPAVLAAVSDQEPLRRAAAALVLGQGGPELRSLATRLLADADSGVRFRAANGLLQTGDTAAVPVLIGLLEGAPGALSWQAEELLDRLAGDLLVPVTAGSDAASRRVARLAWESWWKENGSKVDVTRVRQNEAYLGLNLIVELDGAGRGGKGRIWECGSDGRPRWEIKDLDRPIDARLLPNGHVLIAEHGPPRVTERQRDGTIVWQYAPGGQPVSCERLLNGNTFIATYNEIVEVTRDRAVVFSAKVPTQMIFYAQKLRNGHCIYVASSNQIVELDAAGKEVRSVGVENSGGWAGVEQLPNGHFLVALYNAKKVVELDRFGKVVWQCEAIAPGHATRLRNGNTLVASIEGRRIAEFDRSGKEIWHQATVGRPFHAYRR